MKFRLVQSIKCISYLVIFTITLFSDPVFASSNSHYAIFVDAGSSGSRLYLFQYDDSQSIPEIKSVFSASTKPGLSSYAVHPEQAGESLKKLFDGAVDYLNKNGIKATDVPANIMATAGMRLLPELQQQAIYLNVRGYLISHYTFPVREVKTITGQMEAFYGWLDVNYLSRTFQDHQPILGSADVGGASTEIAFVTHDKNVNPADVVSVTIDQVAYSVFSISYLGLGQDQALMAMNNTAGAAACYPQQYSFPQIGAGNFNMDSCGKIYQGIINRKMTKPIPSTQGTSFIAYSGIYYDYSFFDTEGHPDRYTFEDHIRSICSETWPQMKKRFPDVPEKYLSTDCANGVFIDQLIYNDYFLQDERLKVINQINNQDIDWVLGAVLYGVLIK